MPQHFGLRLGNTRSFALGMALVGLMLAFTAASLLVFPYKATANPDLQGELLYDLLGHLEYNAGSGRFDGIRDDSAMQQKLRALIAENHLDMPPASAYIVNLGSGESVWSAASNPREIGNLEVTPAYSMQFITTAEQQVAVQNFWLRDDAGVRIEFRMVVALPSP